MIMGERGKRKAETLKSGKLKLEVEGRVSRVEAR